tara:strand:+ start:499 stop:630 length:132 start_codon:yes stop_codon:yes gene_type:complete
MVIINKILAGRVKRPTAINIAPIYSEKAAINPKIMFIEPKPIH